MRTVGLKVLKNRLSEYVRLAARGETVLISDRDRVVAELVPPGAGRSSELPDALLAEMVRRGQLTPATLPPGARPRSLPGVAPLAELLAELEDDRSSR